MKIKVIDPANTHIAPFFIPTIIRIQENWNKMLDESESDKKQEKKELIRRQKSE